MTGTTGDIVPAPGTAPGKIHAAGLINTASRLTEGWATDHDGEQVNCLICLKILAALPPSIDGEK